MKDIELAKAEICASRDLTSFSKLTTLEALQDKADRDNIQPLNLGQLKGRIGKPIYVQALDGAGQIMSGCWHILDSIKDYDVVVFRDTQWVADMVKSRFYDYEPVN